MTRKKKLQKPSELLNLYSKKLNAAIEKKQSFFTFQLDFQYKNLESVYVSGYVVFRTGWILEFNEIIKQQKTEVIKVKYRYHLMDKAKQLIFRYDNVAHHPEVTSYPHHKHVKSKVTESKPPGLLQVIDEVESLIVKEK